MSTLLMFVAVLRLGIAMSVAGWRVHRRELHEVQRRMAREIQKAAASIGKALVPAMQKLALAFGEMAVALAPLRDALRSLEEPEQ